MDVIKNERPNKFPLSGAALEATILQEIKRAFLEEEKFKKLFINSHDTLTLIIDFAKVK